MLFLLRDNPDMLRILVAVGGAQFGTANHATRVLEAEAVSW